MGRREGWGGGREFNISNHSDAAFVEAWIGRPNSSECICSEGKLAPGRVGGARPFCACFVCIGGVLLIRVFVSVIHFCVWLPCSSPCLRRGLPPLPMIEQCAIARSSCTKNYAGSHLLSDPLGDFASSSRSVCSCLFFSSLACIIFSSLAMFATRRSSFRFLYISF